MLFIGGLKTYLKVFSKTNYDQYEKSFIVHFMVILQFFANISTVANFDIHVMQFLQNFPTKTYIAQILPQKEFSEKNIVYNYQNLSTQYL